MTKARKFPAQSNRGHPNQRKDQAQSQTAITPNSQTYVHKAAADENYGPPAKRTPWYVVTDSNKIIAWGTVVLGIVGIGGLYLTQQSLTVTRDNFHIDQRPYMWLTDNMGQPRFAAPPPAQEAQVLWGKLEFFNYGKTPAQGIRFGTRLSLGAGALTDNGPIDLSQIGAPLPPNKHDFTTGISKENINRDEFTRLVNQTDETIVLRGRFEYFDMVGTKYETAFCIYHLHTGAISYCSDSKENYVK